MAVGLTNLKRILRRRRGFVPDTHREQLKPGPKKPGPRGRKARLTFKKPPDRRPRPPPQSPGKGPVAPSPTKRWRFTAVLRAQTARIGVSSPLLRVLQNQVRSLEPIRIASQVRLNRSSGSLRASALVHGPSRPPCSLFFQTTTLSSDAPDPTIASTILEKISLFLKAEGMLRARECAPVVPHVVRMQLPFYGIRSCEDGTLGIVNFISCGIYA